jgi:hypothetical protein
VRERVCAETKNSSAIHRNERQRVNLIHILFIAVARLYLLYCAYRDARVRDAAAQRTFVYRMYRDARHVRRTAILPYAATAAISRPVVSLSSEGHHDGGRAHLFDHQA